jgi:hypothetical protein
MSHGTLRGRGMERGDFGITFTKFDSEIVTQNGS